ncbi:MAG TPA: hypothetical protein VFN30_08825 [Chitinophagaceae bacterium]|nr:hypothetical protein [Chitinophagaceae bacterium]
MYTIVLKRRKHILLRLANVKVVIEGKEIYPLEEGKETIIHSQQNNIHLVVTDGFHISKPLELVFHHIHTYYLHVDCVLSNVQLFYGVFFMLFLFVLGFFTGIVVLQLLSFFPLGYLIYVYYINRHDFIQLHPM